MENYEWWNVHVNVSSSFELYSTKKKRELCTAADVCGYVAESSSLPERQNLFLIFA